MSFIKMLTKEKNNYSIDGFIMDMGAHHILRRFQRIFKMYDRFVPYLAYAAEQKKGKIIVDVGANVGDTLAGMIRHFSGKFICVEPDDHFFELLIKNVNNFGKKYKRRVYPVNCMIVGKDEKEMSFGLQKTHGGTAKRRSCVDRNNHKMIEVDTIDSVIRRSGYSLKDVSLIKTDTDGFDSKCIMSIGNELFECSPLLFWENEIDEEYQYNDYVKMADYLNKCGYDNYYIFDNYGNFLTKTDTKGLKYVDGYLLRTLKKRSPSTFAYVDVLACKNNDILIVEKTVNLYLSKY